MLMPLTESGETWGEADLPREKQAMGLEGPPVFNRLQNNMFWHGQGCGKSKWGRWTAQITALLLTAVALAGCSAGSSVTSWFSSSSATTTSAEADVPPPEAMYQKADQLLAKRDFEAAAKAFEEVDRQHPYSPLARRAIVMAAYAHYKQGNYAQAIAGGRRYVTLHPGTKETALAQHIIASSYFDQIKGPRNDQTLTQKAHKELKILLRRHPNSRYAEKARNRLLIVEDLLAAAEMNVGRYYQKKKNYLAALNRYKTVIKKYQTTAHVQEALLRITETYLALGVVPEAESAAAVLGHNFPNSKWYKRAYALLQSGGNAPQMHSGSWLASVWRTTVKGVKALTPL